MSAFHFWARITTALALAAVGVFVGDLLDAVDPFSPIQIRIFFGLIGLVLGFLIFSHLASWIATTFAGLLRKATNKIVSEMINQITTITSRGHSMGRFAGEILDKEERRVVGGAIILDTSCIIDGRVLDVAKTGFLNGLVFVPNFVLVELQQVADSADDLKRKRGRRGFEIINDLKKINGIKLEVWDKELTGKSVDEKLVRLGKIIHGRILTCDYNLNKVASLNGVKILNFNDLTNALKSLPIPGEQLTVHIINQGKDDDQGVGYLQDGTMVVVKGANTLIGKELSVEVSKIIQGPAGRIIFAKSS